MAIVSSFLTFALCLLPFALRPSAQSQRPVFRAGAVLVTVDAYPQRNGQIVEGLNPADFEILEDGKPQKVENFEFIRIEPVRSDDERRDPNSGAEGNALAADPRNRAFVVFLDVYHVTFAGAHYTRQPLVDSLRRLLAPNDLFGVTTPRMRPTDLVFGRGLTSIDEQLAKHWMWGEGADIDLPREPEDIELFRQFEYDRCGNKRSWLPEALVARRHEEKTLLSLEDLVRHLGNVREARTVLLLFGQGWPLFERDARVAAEAQPKKCPGETQAPPPPLPGVGVGPGGRLVLGDKTNGDEAPWISELLRLANIDDGPRFRDLVKLAADRNVSIYPINPEGLQVSLALTSRLDALRVLAENTGGIAIVDTNDLAGGVKRIVNDMSAYYLLGYYSTNPTFDGRFRRIEVRMKAPGVAVKARRGYFAPSLEGAKPTASEVPDAAGGKTPAAMTEALAVLSRLRPSAEVFVAGAVSHGDLAFVAEIASGQIAAGKWAQGAEVQAVVTDPAGTRVGTATGRIEAGSRGVLMRLPVDADAAGPWQVAVKVSGGSDTIEDRATITKGVVSPLLGDPIVFRAAPGPRSPLRPVADLQFRRTERVHIEWPMLKPFDDRQARLLGRTGQPLPVEVNVTAVQSVLGIDLNLAPLGAGDYVIVVTAGTGEKTERRFIAFRVVQ